MGPPTAEALQISSDHQELEQLQKEVQTLQDRLSGIPTHPGPISSPYPHLGGGPAFPAHLSPAWVPVLLLLYSCCLNLGNCLKL